MRIVPPKVLIELGPSSLAGIGVFAATTVKVNQRIASGIAASDYRSLIPWANFDSYDAGVREKIMAFCVGTPEGFIPPDKLDFNRLSIEWYLNHSCIGNVGFNEDGDFVARRLIRKGDELTYDYALAESNPRFRMECRCDAVACRRVITGNDWKALEFQEKNRAYMLPRLRRIADGRRIEVPKVVRAVARRR